MKTEFKYLIGRIVIVFLLLASPFANVHADNALPRGEFQDLRPVGSARIKTVINPYTLLADDGEIYRLSGIEFPDYNFSDEPGEFSLTALKILKDLSEDQEFQIYQTKDRDKGRLNRMGHTLAHLERSSDGAWVQGSLVALGLARVYTSESNPEMAAQLYELEDSARKHNLGVWGQPEFQVQSAQDSVFEHLHSQQVVEGIVQSVAMVNNTTYVNFGENWREDFTISIDSDARRQFRKAQIDPQQWNGKHLRVRGWVQDYNGPYIEATHPAQIEILDEDEKNSPGLLPEEKQAPMVGIIE